MSDIFISYARSTEAQAKQIAEALRALGYGVWRDDELPAHRPYAEVIEERLKSAKAVVVVWSAEAVKSQWVRAEANVAREAGTLVQVRLDGATPPLPFKEIQCADLIDWSGDPESPGWRKVTDSIAALTAERPPAARDEPTPARKLSICVLPFANMSGDLEQEYFSDGISEDIITDLSKVSALSVTARNTAFGFKDKSPNVKDVARQLGVSHILEGSVRKAGGRVRITAQLIDGAAGDHIWAERYDRDLTDIFALQDEISEAIVNALKLKLMPEEKRAIERRGTDNVEAYNFFLMARQHWPGGNLGDPRREEMIVRICTRATELDPKYARAWALMGLAQSRLQYGHGRSGLDVQSTLERALELDPDLAEAHALKARQLGIDGRYAEAEEAIARALCLDPNSYEVNSIAADLNFRQHRLEDAVPYFEKAAALIDIEFGAPLMLITCYSALGDSEGVRRAARLTLERAEKVLAQDRSNGAAVADGATALAALGEADRARNWIERALLIDPDNLGIPYNLACALCAYLGDTDGALDLMSGYFAKVAGAHFLHHATVDPDLDSLREHPRFKAMLAEAEARLAATTSEGSA